MRSSRASYTGVLGGRRACLGKDGRYSIENCNGSLYAQGIGVITGEAPTTEYVLFVPLGSDSLLTSDSLTFKVIAA